MTMQKNIKSFEGNAISLKEQLHPSAIHNVKGFERVASSPDDENDATNISTIAENEDSNHVLTWADYRFKSHLFLPWLWDAIVENERLKKVARTLFGSETIVIWSTDWCVKPFSSKGHFSWHQDSTYSRFGGEALTIWIAFSDLESEMCGPVAFKKGSHKLEQMPHIEKKATKESENNNMLALGQTIPETFDKKVLDRMQKSLTLQQTNWMSNCETILACPLRCGMATAHSFLTIHSSQANRHPSIDRVGLAIRLVNVEDNDYITNTSNKRPDHVTLLCGSPENVKNFGGFEKRPTQDFGEEEMREWRLSIQRENEFYFQSSQIKQYNQ